MYAFYQGTRNPGGPGVGGRYVPAALLPAELGRRFDLIGFDTRGTFAGGALPGCAMRSALAGLALLQPREASPKHPRRARTGPGLTWRSCYVPLSDLARGPGVTCGNAWSVWCPRQDTQTMGNIIMRCWLWGGTSTIGVGVRPVQGDDGGRVFDRWRGFAA